MSAPVLVLGGTGTTGSRVTAFLRARDATARVATRSPSAPGQVRFDWTDPTTHTTALDGAGAVYLVAPIGVAEPAPLVAPFLDAARTAGVRRVVLLCSSAVPDSDHGMGALPALVRDRIDEATVLRPSWFMQNLLGDHPVAAGIREQGEIVTATGDGRVGFVDAGDIAAVAGHALLDTSPHPPEHLITGPEALSYADAAAVLADVSGSPVRHRPVTEDELVARFTAAGYPGDFSAILAALDVAIAGGAEDRVTDTVRRVTGRAPRTLREVATNAMAGAESGQVTAG
ncbi:NAD(P)H-binding protein [Pseudonocardia sp. KRD291]|uniref:NAD(P)H-binding protein n=1 Tax=Pseudonocardia sp. KRD291 TaxID=2792007 RepID=UPI001C4A1761|nr:NAD(P)H-binding protein [Pseudonocardia sp. KRD291]MBW0105116.1 NAD(P)H-binding protein [Pseudonocardia sp. KRD291]